MIRAVIFDFDGLILDTETSLFEVWRELYAEFGVELAEEMWASNVGGYTYEKFHPYHFLAENAGQPVDLDWLHQERIRRHHARVDTMPIMAGVEDTIAAAREAGLRVGLASSSERKWVARHLDRLGLAEKFEAMWCGDEVPAIKPDPALYANAAKSLDVAPEEAVALEDSPKGIGGAKAAGLYCVAVPNPVTRHQDLSQADREVASLASPPFRDLLAEIEEVLSGAL